MRDTLDQLAETSLAPLDAARERVLRAFGPLLAPLFADRAARTTTLGVTSALVLFATTCAAPIALLAIGPIVLGVPHLVADLRYLVVRRGLHARFPVVLAVLFPLLLALLIPTIELSGVVTIGAACVARGPRARRILVALFGVALGLLGHRLGRDADVIFAHVHNGVALVLWWSLAPSRARHEWLVPAVTALGVVLLALGVPRFTLDSQSFVPLRDVLPLDSLLATLAPTGDVSASIRWVLIFAFAQSMHYATWLRLVPEDARERRAPRSFSSSYRALRAELGAVTLVACVAVALGIVVWSTRDLEAARLGYLKLALFHGPLEIGLASLAFAERRRL